MRFIEMATPGVRRHIPLLCIPVRRRIHVRTAERDNVCSLGSIRAATGRVVPGRWMSKDSLLLFVMYALFVSFLSDVCLQYIRLYVM